MIRNSMKFYSHLKITSFVFLVFLIFIFSFDLSLQYLYNTHPGFILEQARVYIGHMLLWSVFVAFLLSAAVGFAAFLLVTRPVTWLTNLMRLSATDKWDKKIFLRSNDELQDLAESADALAARIKYSVHSEAVERSRLEAVFLNMFEGLMIVDEKANVALMNQRLKKILTVLDDYKGKGLIEVIRNREIVELTELVLKSGKGVEDKELKLVFPYEDRVLMVNAAPVYWGQMIQGVVLVFHDISDIRRLEKIRRDFVANVSHELRTPIANIHGFAETLLDGAIDDKQHALEFLNIIYNDSSRLSKLVADLLNLSRIESGKWDLSFKECSLKKVIERVVSSLRQVADSKSVNIQVDIPNGLESAWIDEVGLEQILFNITENALKYGKQNGLVKIEALVSQEEFGVKISDNGIGIPREDQARVFERFYRVDKARSLHEGGTGLGLSIVKHIVELMSGRVVLESEVGQGSSFTVFFPHKSLKNN
ncbi:MAG: hypothetical protein HQL25_08405 [Candidatus Omnitrophica bacterium]|nr:hypothetical protein [Candidatus Omnitrophota bacterium]